MLTARRCGIDDRGFCCGLVCGKRFPLTGGLETAKIKQYASRGIGCGWRLQKYPRSSFV